eukprot:scaffold12291_cov133-Skeletonema_marinoi.AAC.4
MNESAVSTPSNDKDDDAANNMLPAAISASAGTPAHNASTDNTASTIPVSAVSTGGTPRQPDDTEDDREQQEQREDTLSECLTDKQQAALQVLNMFTEQGPCSGLIKDTQRAREKMLIICRDEMRLSNLVITLYLQKMKKWSIEWVDSKEINTRLAPEEHQTQDTGDDTPGQREIAQKVDRDLCRLIEAARVGDLSVQSWFINHPNKWRIIKIPPINKIQRDIKRAEFLHQVDPNGHVTLMHNSLVSIHLPSAQALLHKWCVGYHFHTTSWDTLDPAYSSFFGNEVYLGMNDILKAINNIPEDVIKPSDVKEDHEDYHLISQICDQTNVPNMAVRSSKLYQSLFPDREVFPPLEELKERIGTERFEGIMKSCREAFIFPDGDDVMTYLDKHRKCHMIMPGLWLGWKSLCSNPHLFHILDVKLKKFLDSGADADDDDEEEEEGGESTHGIKHPLSYPREYDRIREYFVDELDHTARVEAMEKYLNEGVMKMLRGDIPGALKENESRDNAFLNTNFFRAQIFHLTKQDRFRYYHPNTRNEHGRYSNSLAVSNDYMRKACGVALGGCHNTPGHRFLVRVKLAVAMFKSHLIEHGGNDYPITKMNCMVTMNHYQRSLLEVHRFGFRQPLYHYQGRNEAAMQKLREEEEENRKRSRWSNWENSSDDSSYSDNSDDVDDDGLNLAHDDVVSKEEEDRLKMLERFEFMSSRLEPEQLVEGFVGFEDQLKDKSSLEYTRYSLRHGSCIGRVKRSGGRSSVSSETENIWHNDESELDNSGNDTERASSEEEEGSDGEEHSRSVLKRRRASASSEEEDGSDGEEHSRSVLKRRRASASSEEEGSDGVRSRSVLKRRRASASSEEEANGSSSDISKDY